MNAENQILLAIKWSKNHIDKRNIQEFEKAIVGYIFEVKLKKYLSGIILQQISYKDLKRRECLQFTIKNTTKKETKKLIQETMNLFSSSMFYQTFEIKHQKEKEEETLNFCEVYLKNPYSYNLLSGK